MIDKERSDKARKAAEAASKRLFGNRTPEQEEALKNIQTIGSPENLIEPTKEDEDDES